MPRHAQCSRRAPTAAPLGRVAIKRQKSYRPAVKTFDVSTLVDASYPNAVT
jgi:hypothetical protein